MASITGVDCSRISTGAIAAICQRRAVAGTNSRVIIGNYSDIDRDATVTIVTDNVISALGLADLAYEFITYEDTTVGSVELEAGTYINELTHQIVLRIFVKNQDIKNFVDQMLNATVFVILENKENGDAGEVKWEMYGFNSGLKVTALTGTTEMTDGVVYEITLASPDGSKEGTLPLSIWAGSYADTEAILNGLVTEPETPEVP